MIDRVATRTEGDARIYRFIGLLVFDTVTHAMNTRTTGLSGCKPHILTTTRPTSGWRTVPFSHSLKSLKQAFPPRHQGASRSPVVITWASKDPKSLPNYRALDPVGISLRSEAEAPFRVVRIVLFGFFGVSASLATLFAIPQLIGSLAGAPSAMDLTEVLQGLGIDVVSVLVFAFLLRNDLKARDKQIARLSREETLGALGMELGNGKRVRLAQLRGFARCVMVTGTAQQVADALQAAEPYKERLIERGVFVIPLPIFETGGADALSAILPPPTAEDLRWRCTALRLNEWEAWFKEQMAAANKVPDKGLYIGLRMDGRVRASGVGQPPWAIFAAQLPPANGMWTGFMDGFDGSVNMF